MIQQTNKVIIESIGIVNFMSFHNCVFNFENTKCVHLMIGNNLDIPSTHNGAGKTALFSALAFGLFGETLHNLNVGSIQHRKYLTDDVEVVVKFSTQNKKYRVVTTIEKSVYTRIHLFENDIEITKPGIKETRKYIEEELLKMSFDVFKRRVILINDNTRNFFEMRPHEKRAFIEDNFALNIFGRIFALIHQDSISTKHELEANEKQLKTLDGVISDLTKTDKHFIETKTQRIAELTAQIQEKFEQLKTIFHTAEVAAVPEHIKETVEQIEAHNTATREIDLKINKLDRELIKLEKTIELSSKHKKQYAVILEKICEKCVKTVKEFINISNTEEVTTIAKKLVEIIAALRKEKAVNSTVLSELKSKSLQASRVQHEITGLKHKLNENVNHTSQVAELITKNKAKHDTTQKKLANLIDNYKYIDFAEYIVSEDGVKKFVIANIIQLLNQRIQFYLAKLGTSYTCIFSENFDVEFRTESGKCDFNNFSSGEKMRIKIAALFSFRDLLLDQVLVDFNILVVDEFLDSSLDDFAITKILEIMREISNNHDMAVYIISHRKEIKTLENYFTSKFLIEKKLGESTISIVK